MAVRVIQSNFKTLEVDSVAQLKLTSPGAITGVKAVTLGYYANGDGGGNSFYWDAASTATDNGGTIIQVTGVATGRWLAVDNEEINVRQFGAKGDGTTDDYAAAQAAIDTAVLKIKFPEGNFKFETGLISNTSRQRIVGEGIHRTAFTYGLAGTGTLITFVASGVTNIGEDQVPTPNTFIYQCGISGILFNGGSAVTKTGIKLVNINEFAMDDVAFLSWGGTRSIGIHTKGSAFLSANRLSISAPLPMLWDVGPTFGVSNDISVDHFNFNDIYLLADGYPCILGNGYGFWTNVSFDGYNAGVQGTHWMQKTKTGFTATGNSGTEGVMTIRNLRTEQGSDSAAYNIRLEQCGEVTLIGCYLDSIRNGIYARGVNTDARLNMLGGGYYGGAGKTAIDVDGTLREVSWSNYFWQSNSTKSFGTLVESLAVRVRAEDFYSTAIYGEPSTGADPSLAIDCIKLQSSDYFIWKGTIASGTSQTFNIGGLARPFLDITVNGWDATGTANIGGKVIDYVTTNVGSAPQLLSNAGAFQVGAGGGFLSYTRAAGNTSIVTIDNNVGNLMDVVVKIIKI